MKNQLPEELRAYFSQMGKMGGSKGGKTTASRMTPQQRIERAKKAVQARERKRRQREKEKEAEAS
jgi:hypothetical protein